jgi:hypothetical protein
MDKSGFMIHCIYLEMITLDSFLGYDPRSGSIVIIADYCTLLFCNFETMEFHSRFFVY